MQTVEFETVVQDGKITVPPEYADFFPGVVRVVLELKNRRPSVGRRTPGSGRGRGWMAHDFDAPLELRTLSGGLGSPDPSGPSRAV